MAQITLKGNAIETAGELPALNSKAPDFTLVGADLGEVKLSDYQGKKVLLNIFPSLDTAVCAASVRRFNEEAAKLENTVVLSVSADLPFAFSRFCEAEGIKNVVSASVFRTPEFGNDYGVTITTGPLAGLLSRSVVVVNSDGNVAYTEQVPEIVQDPDFDKALSALSEAS